jgi:DNA primase
MTNFKRIKYSAKATTCRFVEPEDFYEEELPDLKKYQNGTAWACCPFHDDNNPSFSVNLDTGSYQCHSSACEVGGPNIVSFVSALYGLDFLAAKKYIEVHYG